MLVLHYVISRTNLLALFPLIAVLMNWKGKTSLLPSNLISRSGSDQNAGEHFNVQMQFIPSDRFWNFSGRNQPFSSCHVCQRLQPVAHPHFALLVHLSTKTASCPTLIACAQIIHVSPPTKASMVGTYVTSCLLLLFYAVTHSISMRTIICLNHRPQFNVLRADGALIRVYKNIIWFKLTWNRNSRLQWHMI